MTATNATNTTTGSSSSSTTSSLLAGRRGVVLGVSGENSIGWHVARALRSHGARVSITCRPNRLAQVTSLAASIDTPVHGVDIDDEASLAGAFAVLSQDSAPLDFLVHTWVGVPAELLARPLVDVARADFERVMSLSAWSLIAACKHARPLLARSPSPRVVALTSGCSHRMTPGYHVAGIAKAALESAVLYLAMQLGREGILVNAVASSFLATDGALRVIGAKAAEGTRAVQAKRSATGRAVELGEVADSVTYLCSPLARNVTGEILTVDGGFGRSYL